MMRGRPPRYSSRQRFVIEVLFLRGLSADRISRFMHGYGIPMTRAQVQGQISVMGYRRQDMTVAERQLILDELKKAAPVDLPASLYRVAR